MNLWVPYNARNFLTNCKPVSFSRRILHHGVSKCINVRIAHFRSGKNADWQSLRRVYWGC